MKVRKIERPMDAIQFTGDNQDEITAFIGRDGHSTRLFRNGKTQQIQISFEYGYIRTLGVGDYLVKNHHEIYDRVNRDVFERNYEVLDG